MSEPKTILIVDDDEDFTTAVATLLERNGYVVHSARDGREGLAQARKLRPDLILLDVMMAERTEGFFTLQHMRSIPELKDVPVIVLSSIYSSEPAMRVEPDPSWLPCDLFLKKPVEPEVLLKEVAERTGRATHGAQGGAPTADG